VIPGWLVDLVGSGSNARLGRPAREWLYSAAALQPLLVEHSNPQARRARPWSPIIAL